MKLVTFPFSGLTFLLTYAKLSYKTNSFSFKNVYHDRLYSSTMMISSNCINFPYKYVQCTLIKFEWWYEERKKIFLYISGVLFSDLTAREWCYKKRLQFYGRQISLWSKDMGINVGKTVQSEYCCAQIGHRITGFHVLLHI